MLREAHIARNLGLFDEAAQTRGQELVVETQTKIEVFRLLAVRPPTVQLGFAGDFAQGVDVAHVAEDLVHPGPFGRHETGLVLTVSPVLHVQLEMGNVQRAAVDEFAALATLLVQVVGEVFHELELLVQVGIAVAAGWQQQRADAELVEVGLHEAAVTVGRFKAQPHDDCLGRRAGVDRNAALGRGFGFEAVLPVAIQPVRVLLQFGGGDADVLQTDDIGILGAQPVKQATLGGGLYSVDVETDDSHAWSPKKPACMIPELEGLL